MDKEQIVKLYGKEFYEKNFTTTKIGTESDRAVDSRAAAIEERNGYAYARYVDKAPRDDTRKAAIEKMEDYEYARYVDEIIEGKS